MSLYDVTLVFCTCGRTKEVADFFSALLRDTSPELKLQVIVVDQNPDRRLEPVLKDFFRVWQVEYVRTSTRGVSLARNLVLPKIQGQVVAFPDDDCLYLDHTLENVIAFFAEHPDVDIAVGIWSDLQKPEFPAGHFEKKLNPYTLFKKGEAFVQFYRRSAVAGIGPFDPDFGPGPQARYPYGGDDSDYLLRGVFAGLHAMRCSRIHVVHPLQDTAGMDLKKIRGYGVTRMMLLKKHSYPLWFRLANVAYPLSCMVRFPRKYSYFKSMFQGRMSGFLKTLRNGS